MSQGKHSDLTSSVDSIPFIVEGEIEFIELFCTDKNGNQLPYDSLNWNNNIGTWKPSDNANTEGFSKAGIRVCHIYKAERGSISDRIKIVTSSKQLMPFVVAIEHDTIMSYHFAQPTHNRQTVFLPNSVGSRFIFFLQQETTSNNTFVLSSLGTIFYHPNFTSDKRNRWSNAAFTTGTGIFYEIGTTQTREELLQLLEQLNLKIIYSTDFCKRKNPSILK